MLRGSSAAPKMPPTTTGVVDGTVVVADSATIGSLAAARALPDATWITARIPQDPRNAP